MASFRAQPPHPIGAGHLQRDDPNPNGVQVGMLVYSIFQPDQIKRLRKIAGTKAWLEGEKKPRNPTTLMPTPEK